MAQARIDIVVNDASLESLEAQLAQLNTRIKQVAIGSAEFKQLATQIKGVQGEIEKANLSLQKFDIGRVVGEASKIFGGLAAGVAGISALFIDVEDSTEAAAEAQQRLAAAFGIVQLAEAAFTAATFLQTQALTAQLVETEAVTAAKNQLAIANARLTASQASYAEAAAMSGEAEEIAATFVARAKREVQEAEEALSTAAGTTEAATKATGLWGKALAILTNPLTIAIGAITALYFIVDQLQSSFEEGLVVRQYGTEIEDLSELVKSSVGGFSNLTKQVIAYQTAVRNGSLSTEQYDLAQKNLSKSLLETGIAQADVNDIVNNGADALDKYIALIPELIKQQVIFQAIGKEFEKILTLQTDASASAPDFLQTLGNFAASLGNNFVFTIKQNETALKNFAEQTGQSEEQIEKLLKIFEESAKQFPDGLNSLLFGKGGAEETKTTLQDLSGEITNLQRTLLTERLEGQKDEFQERRDLLDQQTKFEIADLAKRNKEVQAADDVTAEQKRQFAKATNDAITALRENAVKELNAIDKEQAAKEAELAAARYDKALADLTTALDNQLELQVVTNQKELAANELKYLTGEQSEQEYYNNLYQIQRDALELAFEQQSTFLKNQSASLDAEIKKLEGKTDEQSVARRQELVDQKKASDQELLVLEEQYQADVADLQNEQLKTQQEILEKGRDQEKEDQETRLEVLQQYVDAAGEILVGAVELYAQQFQTQLDLLNIETQSELDILDERLKASQESFAARKEGFERSTLLSAKARANALLQLEEEQLAKERAIEAQRQNLEKQAAKQGLEIQAKQNKASLAIAIAQAIAQAASGIVTATAQAPLTFGASLALIAPIAVSLAAAIGAFSAQSKVIDAQVTALGFAQGGLVTGPGSGTSDSIPARLSNGEFVVNAQSTSANLPLLQELNTTGGGGGNMTALLSKLSAQLDNLQNQPVKAYVVTSELEEANRTSDYISRRAQL